MIFDPQTSYIFTIFINQKKGVLAYFINLCYQYTNMIVIYTNNFFAYDK